MSVATRRPTALNALIIAFLVIWVIAAAFPFAWTVWGSFKVEADFFSRETWWNAIAGVYTQRETGGAFTGDGYEGAWIEQKFWVAVINTAIVTVSVVVISLTIGTTSRKTFRPSWTNSLSAVPAFSGAARLRKPKLLRMLLENTVFSLVPRIAQCSAGAMAASSTSTAVATSPKMKWLSRSRQLRWPEVISGLTTSTDRALPARM